MAERQVESRELFWSALWWGAALVGALIVLAVVARLDGMAAGLVFGGVTFMLLGCIFTSSSCRRRRAWRRTCAATTRTSGTSTRRTSGTSTTLIPGMGTMRVPGTTTRRP
jgi:hypothetical protein